MAEAPTQAWSLGWVLVIGAGLLGAAGVVLSAVAAHKAGSATLGVAGSFCLLHAGAVLAIGTGAVRSRLLSVAGMLLLLGAVLFAGGVAVTALSGVSPGPLAPTGGLVLIGGWLLVALAGGVALKAKTTAKRS